MNCPLCGHENIPGDELCSGCGQSLTDLHLQSPPTAVERALLKDRVAILNPCDPIKVGPSSTVREVIDLLVDHSIGCVLVTEGDKLVGIFSERDAIQKLGGRASELRDQPVANFMTTHPESLDAKAKIAFAAQRMDLGGYRHVPVVDEAGKTGGVISVRDILQYLTVKLADE